ncbi:MAG: hypothetical protein IKL65_03360 [Bacilli bacterium]|nr:hypothetical protein [Bacilli bacterium]
MKQFKVLMLMVLVMLLTACGPKKEAIDEDDFTRIMTNEGFSIVNVEEQFEKYGHFEEAYLAIDPNNKYQIEFYELEEDEYAKSFYQTNKEKFEQTKTNISIETNIDLSDNNRYTLTTGDEYKVISRIEDTVIYLNVNKKYKEEVNIILKKLGY